MANGDTMIIGKQTGIRVGLVLALVSVIATGVWSAASLNFKMNRLDERFHDIQKDVKDFTTGSLALQTAFSSLQNKVELINVAGSQPSQVNTAAISELDKRLSAVERRP